MSYHSSRRYSRGTPRQALEVRSADRRTNFWIWLAPLVVGAACLFVINMRSYSGGAGRDENREAAMAAINFAKARFGPGVVLRFAPLNWTHVEHQADRYVISGWVETIRRDTGLAATYDYTCEMSRDTGGDWHLRNVDFFRSP